MNQWITHTDNQPIVLAVDPGNSKTGVALLDVNGKLVKRIIVDTPLLETCIRDVLTREKQLAHIVCGNGTNHRKLYPLLESLADQLGCHAHLVNEAYTTEEAKKLYWIFNPPKGLKRLIPKGMRVPPEPVDDITAFVIGQRWFQENND